MTMPGPTEIDAIVRAVVAELNRRASAVALPAPNGHGTVFAGRLLGALQVESLDRDETEIRLAPGTVVTPIAADLLKRRGIALRYVSRVSANESGEWAFSIVGKGNGNAEAIRRALLLAWSEVDSREAPAWVVGGAGRGALVLTAEASIASWRANQTPGVRAATVADLDAVARAVRHLGVNVLVVEPAGLSIPTVKAMAEAFRKGGAPIAPGELR